MSGGPGRRASSAVVPAAALLVLLPGGRRRRRRRSRPAARPGGGVAGSGWLPLTGTTLALLALVLLGAMRARRRPGLADDGLPLPRPPGAGLAARPADGRARRTSSGWSGPRCCRYPGPVQTGWRAVLGDDAPFPPVQTLPVAAAVLVADALPVRLPAGPGRLPRVGRHAVRRRPHARAAAAAGRPPGRAAARPAVARRRRRCSWRSRRCRTSRPCSTSASTPCRSASTRSGAGSSTGPPPPCWRCWSCCSRSPCSAASGWLRRGARFSAPLRDTTPMAAGPAAGLAGLGGDRAPASAVLLLAVGVPLVTLALWSTTTPLRSAGRRARHRACSPPPPTACCSPRRRRSPSSCCRCCSCTRRRVDGAPPGAARRAGDRVRLRRARRRCSPSARCWCWPRRAAASTPLGLPGRRRAGHRLGRRPGRRLHRPLPRPRLHDAPRPAWRASRPSLTSAALSLGARPRRVLTGVHLPLARSGVAVAAVLVAVDALKELPIVLLLRPFGFDTLAVQVWQLAADSRYEMAGLPALAIVAGCDDPRRAAVPRGRRRRRAGPHAVEALDAADVVLPGRGAPMTAARAARRRASASAARPPSTTSRLAVADGELVALVGPSGCGKSTLLMLAAGLLAARRRRGAASAAGSSPAAARWVPPEDRRVGVVFQDAALFPHLRVADNVAFGLPRGRDRAARVARAARARRPAGPRPPLPARAVRRAAAARGAGPRAGARARRVVLFDEAFGNLDHGLRVVGARRDRRRAARAPAPPASSSRTTRARRWPSASGSCVMRDGRFEHVGEPADAFHRPATRFVATLLGEADFVPGRQSGAHRRDARSARSTRPPRRPATSRSCCARTRWCSPPTRPAPPGRRAASSAARPTSTRWACRPASAAGAAHPRRRSRHTASTVTGRVAVP